MVFTYLWFLVKTVLIFAVSVRVSPSVLLYVNFSPTTSFSAPLYAKQSWKKKKAKALWNVSRWKWKGTVQHQVKSVWLLSLPFVSSYLTSLNVNNKWWTCITYHWILVQWHRAVLVTRLFGVRVLEENLSVPQRPSSTETRVLHRSSAVFIGELLTSETPVNCENPETDTTLRFQAWESFFTNLGVILKVVKVRHIIPFLLQDLWRTLATHELLQSCVHLLIKCHFLPWLSN